MFHAPPTESGEQKSERIVLANAVIIAVSGGLANQMMCYKAGRYLASLKGSILILDATLYEADHMSNRNFQLLNYPIEYDALIYSSAILNSIKESNGVRVVEKATIPAPTSETAGAFLRDLVDRKIVYGNFWLALFLRQKADDYAQETGMLSELTLDPASSFDETNHELLKLISESANPVAIHVRRGDYATHDGNLLLKTDYYNASIRTLEARLPQASFFVFSDDIPWCRHNLVATAPIHFVDANDERHAFRDMYLASQCFHFVLSNESTFSHQIVQLSSPRADRIILTSTWDDLVRNS